MASIPWTSVLFLYSFFRSLAQPVAGYIQIRKYRNNCRGNEQMLCFIFNFSLKKNLNASKPSK